MEFITFQSNKIIFPAMSVGENHKQIKSTRYLATIIFIMVAFCSSIWAQSDILEQDVTIKMLSAKRQTVFRSLTRQTGFTFTYDTDLIRPQEFVTIDMENQNLENVLDKMFPDMNFGYSVIENHIIIYKRVDETTNMIEEKGKTPVYLISGTVVEASSYKPLPYATIGIYKKGLGTISNEEGNFTLKVTENSINDSIKVSYLGFIDRTIPVSHAVENQYIIQLERDYVSIPEVIIRSREPGDLIDHIHRNIRANYGDTPSMFRAFYRESISKKNKIQLYSEAVINIYKSAYAKSFQSDQISIYKSRKIENVDLSDTLILKLQAGLYTCLELDGIRNMFDFINPAHYDDYSYQMTDIVNIGDEAAYVVEFTQKEYINDNALFQGSIYINTDNYGVHAVDFEINPEYISILSSNFIKESSRGYSVRLNKVKYKVDYRYVDGRYYLNHVRGDLEFHARKKKKLFGSSYNILFEMAVTGVDTLNVERFTKEEVTPRQTVFWETINQYDSDFWGTDNYMQPEQNIQEALKQLNARMGKFKKEN